MNKDDSHKHNVDPKQQATKVNTFEVKVYKNEGVYEFMNTKFRMVATSVTGKEVMCIEQAQYQ